MPNHLPVWIFISLMSLGCHSEISKRGDLVESVNLDVARIDHNHRVRIIEDDFVKGDSIFKIREYLSGDERIKIVGIVKTSHFERDDYFYFSDGQKIFSGHMINFMDDNLAEEFKYYFKDGELTRAFMWKDNYVPGERFPHETFELFEPDLDSLMNEENTRLDFFMGLIEKEGIEIKQENENVGANH